jgi:membrane-associated phospholipid phosphatase
MVSFWRAIVASFDNSILGFLNSFSQRSWLFDHVVSTFEGEALLKGGVLTAFLWWAWFWENGRKDRDRAILIAGSMSAIVSLAICRIAAFVLPYRERPAFAASLHFQRPLGIDPNTLISWSSFPSDHAGIFISLATTIFFVSRRAGVLAIVYTMAAICFPRVYTGDHYPSDIAAGLAIGFAVTWLMLRPSLRDVLAKWPLRLLEAKPAFFYVGAYLASLLLTTNFDVVRRAGAVLFRGLRTRGGM